MISVNPHSHCLHLVTNSVPEADKVEVSVLHPSFSNYNKYKQLPTENREQAIADLFQEIVNDLSDRETPNPLNVKILILKGKVPLTYVIFYIISSNKPIET